MKQEFVTYEQALALKELGFNEPCLASRDMNNEEGLIQMPLKQQVFRWFREKHNLNNGIGYSKLEDNIWYYQFDRSGIIFGFTTYEEAEDACIDKLLEIVKSGNK